MRALLIGLLLFPVLALAQTPVTQGNGSTRVQPWAVQGSTNPNTTPILPGYQRAAFGALAVAPEQVEVWLQFPYTINPRYVVTTAVATGTVTQSSGMAVLQTGTNATGAAGLSSKASIKYTPGQGISVRFTAVFTPCVANSTQLAGLGDANDGFFFGCEGASFGFVRRKAGVDNFTAQTVWNGDQMLGASGSVQTLDITKGNVYQIDFQWLGFGAIRGFVENARTGEPVLVNTIRYANANTGVSILNPSLPLHGEVTNAGNTSNLILSIGSMGAASQGPTPTEFSVHNAFTNAKTGVGTGDTNIFTLQNKSTFNGIVNRTQILMESISIRNALKIDGVCKLIRNAALGGVPSFADINTAQSIAATDVAGTTVTGGTAFLLAFSIASGTSAHFDLTPYHYRVVPGDTLSFSCAAETSTSDFRVSAAWREDF